jgi:hypothetical protein
VKILITKGGQKELAPHFKESEFFSHQPSPGLTQHEFYTELVEAVAYLRSLYGVAWRITSTYRPDSIGSQHRECRAIDSQDVNSGAGHGSPVMLDLVAQLLEPTSEVFTHLRRLGINGFGVYDSFVHLDCRDTAKFPAAHVDRFGRFAFWDNRTEKKKALPTPKLRPKKLSPVPLPVAPSQAASSS